MAIILSEMQYFFFFFLGRSPSEKKMEVNPNVPFIFEKEVYLILGGALSKNQEENICLLSRGVNY